jgi:hypothetical protein
LDDAEFEPLSPLLKRVVENAPDADIWNAVYELVAVTTPPSPYPHQTPVRQTAASIVNTSELRKKVDEQLKEELRLSIYYNVPGFFDAYFREVTDLAEVVWKKCQKWKNRLYRKGHW